MRVEPHGASQMDGAELAALDEPLHCSWVNMEKVGRLIRRQERGAVRCRIEMALSRRAARSPSSVFDRFVGRSRPLSRRLSRVGRPVPRPLVRLEEGELTCVESHSQTA
jgi:hypothetical protein